MSVEDDYPEAGHRPTGTTLESCPTLRSEFTQIAHQTQEIRKHTVCGITGSSVSQWPLGLRTQVTSRDRISRITAERG